MITAKATQQLEQQASEWLIALQGGEALAQLSEDYSWVEVSDADRGDSRVPAEIRQRAFAMLDDQTPAFELMQLRDGNFAIIRLDAVHQSDVELSADEMAVMMSLLGATKGQLEYQNRVEGLRNSATIQRN